VILASDGDFNVGVSSDSEMIQLVESKSDQGTFLTVLGFGTGNLKDSKMEQMADHGNGNYAYIDSLDEGRRVLVGEMSGTLVTIAKDVKIQVFFNPARVASYRLVGYENRILAAKDFNDDKKDAGDIGAGHTVTALYEIVPAGGDPSGGRAMVDDNPFVEKPAATPEEQPAQASDALLRFRIRYKQPDGDTSKLIETDVADGGGGFDAASRDFRWASAVASFAMRLRGSPHVGALGLDAILEIAESAKGEDPAGERAEFLDLVRRARALREK
jgi:Ca-activated chloride channel family protein